MMNPYSPGAGLVPAVLAGRDAPLREITDRLAHVATYGRSAGSPTLFAAPRGMGKTALLRAGQREAEAVGFVTAWMSARSDVSLVHEIARAIATAMESAGLASGSKAAGWRERLQTLSVEVGVPGAKVGAVFDMPPPGGGDMSSLEQLVQATSGLAREEGRPGLMLVFDELHEGAEADLKTLAYAVQHLQGQTPAVPVAVFGAGLPSLPEKLMDAATFAERFNYHRLDRLTREATRQALVEPAERLGVQWSDEAAMLAVSSAAGYPFVIQVHGDQIWRVASPVGPGVITVEHARRGIAASVEALQPMFRGRWSKASPAERKLLAAMAVDGDGGASRSDVAARLDRTSRSISPLRASLIDKGLIEPVEHGRLQFTTPGFAEFVISQGTDLEGNERGQR